MMLPNLGKHYPAIEAQASSKGTWLGFTSLHKTNHLHRFKESIKRRVMEEYLLVRARVMVHN